MPDPAKGRCVRDEADARQLLDQVRQSELRIPEWCQQNGINKHSLYHWRAKLHRQRRRPRKRQTPTKDLQLPPFAEVQLPAQASRCLLTAPNGWTLQIDGDLDFDALLLAISRC